jgi:hypothetical protein
MLKAKSSGPAAITRIGMWVSPKRITLVPTPYPHDTSAPLVVPDYLQVDTSSPAFIEFSSQLDNVIQLLGKSNRIASETREQLIAEIKAGREILISPRPNRALLRLLLERPLRFIAEAAAAAVIGGLATRALDYLVHPLNAPPPLPL